MRGAIWIAAAVLCAGCESSTPDPEPVPTPPHAATGAAPKPRKVGKPAIDRALAAAANATTSPPLMIAPTAGKRSVVMVPAIYAAIGRSCKPEAPIAVAVASHQLATDRYQLTVTATPSAAVDSVVLELVLPVGASADHVRQSFGSSRPGEPLVLTAIVTTTVETTDLAAVARVPVAAGDRGAPIVISRSTTFVLGVPHAQPITKTYDLPDGERAREVRP